jgi:hypothetical protein
MTFKGRCTAVLLVILVGIPNIMAAQSGKTGVNMPVNRSFDTEQVRLPPLFTGHSIHAIFDAVSRRTDLLKSEFETDAQYESRIAMLADSKLIGDLPLGGSAAFVLTCDGSELQKECDHYDPETGTMFIQMPFDSADPDAVLYPSLNSRQRSLLIRDETGRRIPAGIAQNGFGVRFAISRETMTRYFVDYTTPMWLNKAALKGPGGSLNPLIELSMKPQQAILAKGNIRELIIGRITAPFLGDIDDALNEATLSEPVRRTVHVRSIHMDIDEVWFFNIRTGEVYRKIGPA